MYLYHLFALFGGIIYSDSNCESGSEMSPDVTLKRLVRHILQGLDEWITGGIEIAF